MGLKQTNNKKGLKNTTFRMHVYFTLMLTFIKD